MKKKSISLILAGVMALSLSTGDLGFVPGIASDNCGIVHAERSGACGDGVNYVLDDNGVLTISGIGSYDISSMNEENYLEDVTSIIINEGVTNIPFESLSNCCNLSSMTIYADINEIGMRSIDKYNNLKNIIFKKNIYDIHDYGFSRCENLEEIVFSGDVTYIEHRAFIDNKSLKTIEINGSVSAIGPNFITGCPNLTSVKINCKDISFENTSLDHCDVNTKFYGIPGGAYEEFITSKNFEFVSINSIKYDTGCSIQVDTIKYANTIEFPDSEVMQRDDYEFEGWYLDPEFNNKAVENTEITESITLYAKWKLARKNTFTLVIPAAVKNIVSDGYTELGTLKISDGDIVSTKRIKVSASSINKFNFVNGNLSDRKIGYKLTDSLESESEKKEFIFKASDVNNAEYKGIPVYIKTDNFDGMPVGDYTDTIMWSASIEDIPVSTLYILQPSGSIYSNSTGQLKVHYEPANALCAPVKWESNKTDILVIDENTGEYQALNEGFVIVSATTDSYILPVTIGIIIKPDPLLPMLEPTIPH